MSLTKAGPPKAIEIEDDRIRKVYKSVPVDKRICEGCGEPIIRNLAVFDGELYHYGCLKRTKAKPTHLCLNCFAYLSGKGISSVTVGGVTMKCCKMCEGSHLKPLRRWRGQNQF